MAKPRRRQAGEGGISEYQTKAGPRFLIKFTAQREDGTSTTAALQGVVRELRSGSVGRGLGVCAASVTSGGPSRGATCWPRPGS